MASVRVPDSPRLLLIEDDIPLSDGVARALRQGGYEVDAAYTAFAACEALAARRYALVILDLGLPDLDGSEVVAYLQRLRLDTPVLVLSARDALAERVRLLNLGADDYLVKPMAMAELQARVRALLRRPRSADTALLKLGRLALDLEGQRALVDGKPLDMTAREWAMLAFLAARPDQVVGREEIQRSLYADGDEVSDNAIEKLVSRLRSRLEACGVRLRTVRGLGYYLETPGGTGS